MNTNFGGQMDLNVLNDFSNNREFDEERLAAYTTVVQYMYTGNQQ